MKKQLIIPKIQVTTTPYKVINLPTEMSIILAELIGIHFGDGGIHVRKRKSYTVTYCFNSDEVDLLKDVQSWFKQLFDVEIKYITRKHAFELYCCSKMLCLFLNENFGAPLGKKKHLKIPPIIKSDEVYLKAFIRGLHRTDGCSFKRNCNGYEYPVIKITTNCKEFANEIRDSLIVLGFRAYTNERTKSKYEGYDVVLNGVSQYNKWNSDILNKSGDTGNSLSKGLP